MKKLSRFLSISLSTALALATVSFPTTLINSAFANPRPSQAAFLEGLESIGWVTYSNEKFSVMLPNLFRTLPVSEKLAIYEGMENPSVSAEFFTSQLLLEFNSGGGVYVKISESLSVIDAETSMQDILQSYVARANSDGTSVISSNWGLNEFTGEPFGEVLVNVDENHTRYICFYRDGNRTVETTFTFVTELADGIGAAVHREYWSSCTSAYRH